MNKEKYSHDDQTCLINFHEEKRKEPKKELLESEIDEIKRNLYKTKKRLSKLLV